MILCDLYATVCGPMRVYRKGITAPVGPLLSKGRGDLTRWPGLAGRGWGGTWCCGFPRGCPVVPVVRSGSSWSARSRVAARTNELDAGKRRKILESEEGWLAWGVVSRCVAGGVVSQAPIRRRATARLLSQVIERGVAVSCDFASSPGAGDPSRLVGVPLLAASVSR